jgi:hypothetical protein
MRSAPVAGTCLRAEPVLSDADGDVDRPPRGAAARALLLDAYSGSARAAVS